MSRMLIRRGLGGAGKACVCVLLVKAHLPFVFAVEIVDVEAALQDRLPDQSEIFMNIIREMDKLVNQVLEKLDVDSHGQVSYTDCNKDSSNS